MAGSEDLDLNIAWCIGSFVQEYSLPRIQQIKTLNPTWGGWYTYNFANTNNVICYNDKLAAQLIEKHWQDVCNLWVKDAVWREGLYKFAGQISHPIEHPEDIIAVHLASQNDLCILIGYNAQTDDQDYLGLLHAAITAYPDCQFIWVNDLALPEIPWATVTNLTCDNFENVLSYLL
jgi:hypothetical protein